MPSMRAAINAKCKDCIYDPMPGNGNWRQQVDACKSEKTCALWPFRPRSEPRPESGGSPGKNRGEVEA